MINSSHPEVKPTPAGGSPTNPAHSQPVRLEPHYPFAHLPESGATIEVAPGIHWVRMPLPFALDHINLWLLADGETWTTVDTGYFLDVVKDAWNKLLPCHPLSRVIVTHFHPDHLGLAAWIQAHNNAPLWMTLGEYATAQLIHQQVAGYSIDAMLAFFRAHGLDATRCDALARRGNAYAKGVPEIPATYRRVFAGDEIAIGGRTWRVLIGHGHAAEHASLYCAERKALISGDMLLPRITTNISAFSTNPQGDPLAEFLHSLQAFKALPADTLVLPSHGRPFIGIHDRVAALEAHHTERCQKLEAACITAQSAAELIPVLFDRDIADPHQTMFAMGEAIAHLFHLEHTGRLGRVVENGITRFKRCR
ncbi:MAG: MBL fold metallo-hydrolase [Rhodocyclaceae bacterium]|nr:MBL fold metallo-hydrolase [Rhodocyclaceae bacterium]